MCVSELTGGPRKRLWLALSVSCDVKTDRNNVMFGFMIAFQYDLFTFKLHTESHETSTKLIFLWFRLRNIVYLKPIKLLKREQNEAFFIIAENISLFETLSKNSQLTFCFDDLFVIGNNNNLNNNNNTFI